MKDVEGTAQNDEKAGEPVASSFLDVLDVGISLRFYLFNIISLSSQLLLKIAAGRFLIGEAVVCRYWYLKMMNPQNDGFISMGVVRVAKCFKPPKPNPILPQYLLVDILIRWQTEHANLAMSRPVHALSIVLWHSLLLMLVSTGSEAYQNLQVVVSDLACLMIMSHEKTHHDHVDTKTNFGAQQL